MPPNQPGRGPAAGKAVAGIGYLAVPEEVNVATRPMAPTRKIRQARGLTASNAGKPCLGHCPPQPGPFWGQPEAFLGPPAPALGLPMDLRQVSALLGCSPWTVRQTLIPRGLPHFRFGASGKVIFYRDQVVRWIENQQAKGGKTTS